MWYHLVARRSSLKSKPKKNNFQSQCRCRERQYQRRGEGPASVLHARYMYDFIASSVRPRRSRSKLSATRSTRSMWPMESFWPSLTASAWAVLTAFLICDAC